MPQGINQDWIVDESKLFVPEKTLIAEPNKLLADTYFDIRRK